MLPACSSVDIKLLMHVGDGRCCGTTILGRGYAITIWDFELGDLNSIVEDLPTTLQLLTSCIERERARKQMRGNTCMGHHCPGAGGDVQLRKAREVDTLSSLGPRQKTKHAPDFEVWEHSLGPLSN